MEDIKNAVSILKGVTLKEKYQKYSKLYGFTTENIAGYFSKINFQSKKVLTVCGSGDHVLNAILLGSKEIVTFDINTLTRYLLELKMSAVKEFSYQEFLDFFLLENNQKAMNYKKYQKIKPYLKKEVAAFWEHLYKEVDYDGVVLRNSDLFHNQYDTNQKKLMSNLYLEEQNYETLKQKMEEVTVTFMESSVLELKEKIHDSYDLIFLSNISDYLNTMFQECLLENYQERIIKPLQQKLNQGGKLCFIYQYDVGTERSVVDNSENVQKIFSDVKELEFPSVVGKEKIDKILYIEE